MVCLLCDFKILLTVYNQSYNCQTSHYLGRNQLPKPFLMLPSLWFSITNEILTIPLTLVLFQFMVIIFVKLCILLGGFCAEFVTQPLSIERKAKKVTKKGSRQVSLKGTIPILRQQKVWVGGFGKCQLG